MNLPQPLLAHLIHNASDLQDSARESAGTLAISGHWRLRPDAATVAVGAVQRVNVADVHRVFELLIGDCGQRLLALFLRRQGMAGVAVLADGSSIGTHVTAIVAAEAPRRVEVSHIVGVSLP